MEYFVAIYDLIFFLSEIFYKKKVILVFFPFIMSLGNSTEPYSYVTRSFIIYIQGTLYLEEMSKYFLRIFQNYTMMQRCVTI